MWRYARSATRSLPASSASWTPRGASSASTAVSDWLDSGRLACHRPRLCGQGPKEKAPQPRERRRGLPVPTLLGQALRPRGETRAAAQRAGAGLLAVLGLCVHLSRPLPALFHRLHSFRPPFIELHQVFLYHLPDAFWKLVKHPLEILVVHRLSWAQSLHLFEE